MMKSVIALNKESGPARPQRGSRVCRLSRLAFAPLSRLVGLRSLGRLQSRPHTAVSPTLHYCVQSCLAPLPAAFGSSIPSPLPLTASLGWPKSLVDGLDKFVAAFSRVAVRDLPAASSSVDVYPATVAPWQRGSNRAFRGRRVQQGILSVATGRVHPVCWREPSAPPGVPPVDAMRSSRSMV